MKPVIVVHGGAGSWETDGGKLDGALADCVAACRAGQAVLLEGGSALDAVEAAVRTLEDSPILDAGRGSYMNEAGEIELDAMIMDGVTLDLGAVAAVQFIRHPISLARQVMQRSKHCFLVAVGAEKFADSIAFPRCQIEDLLPQRHSLGGEVDQLSTPDREAEIFPRERALGDTVGAVALDQQGNLAAATSTGGTAKKLPGRVGDSPLVGSGAYADNWTAAVSATGHGEDLMKIVASKRVCDFVGAGLSAQQACQATIGVLSERVQGSGGVIAVDARGQIGVARNTRAMPHAFAIGAEDPTASF
ncbi:MAG: isoaspartyl peptidase/L-asparaginase family protein [Candidatus Promineifilaceae bacterium]